MTEPELLADYGDGVLHRFVWVGGEKLRTARCLTARGIDPERLHLDYKAPEGAALCPWCAEDRAAPRGGYRLPARPGTVPNAPVRAAALRAGIPMAELARLVDRDECHLRRALGIDAYRIAFDGRRVRLRNMSAEFASAVCDALGVEPRELDL